MKLSGGKRQNIFPIKYLINSVKKIKKGKQAFQSPGTLFHRTEASTDVWCICCGLCPQAERLISILISVARITHKKPWTSSACVRSLRGDESESIIRASLRPQPGFTPVSPPQRVQFFPSWKWSQQVVVFIRGGTFSERRDSIHRAVECCRDVDTMLEYEFAARELWVIHAPVANQISLSFQQVGFGLDLAGIWLGFGGIWVGLLL